MAVPFFDVKQRTAKQRTTDRKIFRSSGGKFYVGIDCGTGVGGIDEYSGSF